MTGDVRRARELLHASDPALRCDDRADPNSARARDLMERILVDPPPAPTGNEARRRWRPRSPVIALALAVAVGGLAFVVSDLRNNSSLPRLHMRPAVTARAAPVPTTAGRVFLAAARVTDRRAALPTGTEVVYQQTIAAYLQTFGGKRPASVLAPEVTETWVASDGSGEIRHTYAAPMWPSPRDREAWKAAGSPKVPTGTRDDRFGARELTGDSHRYSADIAELAVRLRREIAPGVGSPDAQMFVRIHELLLDPSTGSRLQGALYRVAAQLRGVTVTGAVTDQLGRAGVALGTTSAYGGKRTRFEMILDPATGRLLEYQEIMLEPASFVQGEPPVQIAFEIQVDRKATSSIGTETDLSHLLSSVGSASLRSWQRDT